MWACAKPIARSHKHGFTGGERRRGHDPAGDQVPYRTTPVAQPLGIANPPQDYPIHLYLFGKSTGPFPSSSSSPARITQELPDAKHFLV